jgi:hypothetical protein
LFSIEEQKPAVVVVVVVVVVVPLPLPLVLLRQMYDCCMHVWRL